MIQKLKTYEVRRAIKEHNDIGEEVTVDEVVFSIRAAIAVSTGNSDYNNLIRSVQSTHTAVFYPLSGAELRQGDVIVDGNSRYRVDYVYLVALRGVAYLRLDGDANG